MYFSHQIEHFTRSIIFVHFLLLQEGLSNKPLSEKAFDPRNGQPWSPVISWFYMVQNFLFRVWVNREIQSRSYRAFLAGKWEWTIRPLPACLLRSSFVHTKKQRSCRRQHSRHLLRKNEFVKQMSGTVQYSDSAAIRVKALICVKNSCHQNAKNA